MRIIPVNKQLILKLDQLADQISGGIIIPASVQEQPYQAVVYLSDNEDYKPGDVVLYRKYSGFEFKLDKTSYLVIEGTDVLVKLEAEESDSDKPELVLRG